MIAQKSLYTVTTTTTTTTTTTNNNNNNNMALLYYKSTTGGKFSREMNIVHIKVLHVGRVSRRRKDPSSLAGGEVEVASVRKQM
jgi:hypothetical protein